MEFVLGALTMLFGVLVGAAILSTTMARTLPSRKELVEGVPTHSNVTIIPIDKEN